MKRWWFKSLHRNYAPSDNIISPQLETLSGDFHPFTLVDQLKFVCTDANTHIHQDINTHTHTINRKQANNYTNTHTHTQTHTHTNTLKH